MSRKSSTDDYRFKSCMLCKNGDLWISGRSLYFSQRRGTGTLLTSLTYSSRELVIQHSQQRFFLMTRWRPSAIDSLLSITSADISEIRLMMDVLLEVYLGKLILIFSS
jgi:hypothetical protein